MDNSSTTQRPPPLEPSDPPADAPWRAWRPVADLPYEANRDGQVRRIGSDRILRVDRSNGWPSLRLSTPDGIVKMAAQNAVALAWLTPAPPGYAYRLIDPAMGPDLSNITLSRIDQRRKVKR